MYIIFRNKEKLFKRAEYLFLITFEVQTVQMLLLPALIHTYVCIPWVVKLKSEGFSLPLGNLTLGSRSSSKKECAQASRGVRRAVGVYSSRREHRAMASGGVRGLNT